MSAPRTFRSVVKGGNFLKPKKWEEWTAGDYVVGIYENASERDLYGKPIYEIKVEEAKITGVNPTITSGDKKGIMPLYANGSLDMQMNEASYGDTIRIEYKGMAVTSKGKFKGKPCHSIELGILEAEGGATNPREEDNSDDLLG